MTTRIPVGTNVRMTAVVDRSVRNDSDYRGIGEVVVDDRSSLPYQVLFRETGETRWFTARELEVVSEGFTLILTTHPIDRDGDLRGQVFVTDAPVNPLSIPRETTGRYEVIGYRKPQAVLAARLQHSGTVTTAGVTYTHAYAVVQGVLVNIPMFAIAKGVTTPQLEIGSVYRIASRDACDMSVGTLVTLIEQEAPEYEGLGYRIKRVNSEDEEWVGSNTRFEKV